MRSVISTATKTVHFTESDCHSDHLAVVVGGFHLKDVGDDAINLHVADETGEKELLCDGRAHQSERRETQEQLGQPGGRGEQHE